MTHQNFLIVWLLQETHIFVFLLFLYNLYILRLLNIDMFFFQAGIIEEMLEDTFESMEDGEDMEEEAEEEVDKILFEITAGEKMCTAG